MRPWPGRRSVKILPDSDGFSRTLAGIGAAAAALAGALRPDGLATAARGTAVPFLEVGAVVLAGWVAVRLGVFRRAARLPRRWPSAARVAVALLMTAAIGGLVNLDVAVVVTMPVAMAMAAESGLAAGALAVAVANTANATSFLLPTSNLTTLLVLRSNAPSFRTYAAGSWIGWLAVTVTTVACLVPIAARRESGWTSPLRPRGADWSLARIAMDLGAMFLLASGLRTFLPAGLTLPGGFATQVLAASALASAADNLPAAAVVHGGGGAIGPWAAILAMSAGANLFVVGSVATVLCRRLARESGAAFSVWRFTAVGVALLPIQIAVACAGLRLSGAIR
ncbi:MAG TPA: hypothetical protein VGH10_05250 [Actinomycetota bacterium]